MMTPNSGAQSVLTEQMFTGRGQALRSALGKHRGAPLSSQLLPSSGSLSVRCGITNVFMVLSGGRASAERSLVLHEWLRRGVDEQGLREGFPASDGS